MIAPTIDLPTLSAGLVEWVRSGGSDDEDTEPRLDRAAAIMAQRLPPEPEWWRFPCDMPADVDPADYWPMINIGHVKADNGLPRRTIHPDKRDTLPPPPRRMGPVSAVTWGQILAATEYGDTIADVARRLDMGRTSLSARRLRSPAWAQRMDDLRGINT